MPEITANMVKELREATGLAMMECKKALVESSGDMKTAMDLLRIKSGAKATRIAGRVAAEGAIGIHVSPDGRTAAMAEVNCETDFVAKEQGFIAFVKQIAELIVQTNPLDDAALQNAKLPSNETVEEARQGLVGKLGENMSIRRYIRMQSSNRIAHYLHGNRIGVLVDFEGPEILGKDLAMHIAASKPAFVGKKDVPDDFIVQEREIQRAKARESGKPADIQNKMVEGAVSKYLAEITLLGQPFVRDDKLSVEQLLKSQNAKVVAFQLFIVGEGIEKKAI
jgi:elongation factor Ts